jgi:hypothetical protein
MSGRARGATIGPPHLTSENPSLETAAQQVLSALSVALVVRKTHRAFLEEKKSMKRHLVKLVWVTALGLAGLTSTRDAEAKEMAGWRIDGSGTQLMENQKYVLGPSARARSARPPAAGGARSASTGRGAIENLALVPRFEEGRWEVSSCPPTSSRGGLFFVLVVHWSRQRQRPHRSRLRVLLGRMRRSRLRLHLHLHPRLRLRLRLRLRHLCR